MTRKTKTDGIAVDSSKVGETIVHEDRYAFLMKLSADTYQQPEITSKVANPALRADRYAKLITLSTEILLRRGFNQISVKDLADEMGWKVGTLYLYISTKQDILYLISNYFHNEIQQALKSLDVQRTAKDMFIASVSKYFSEAVRLNREIRLMNREYASFLPDHAEVSTRRSFLVRQYFADIVRSGIGTGEFNRVHPELIANNIIVLAESWALKRWAFHEHVSREEFISEQIAMLSSFLFSEADLSSDGKERRPDRLAGS